MTGVLAVLAVAALAPAADKAASHDLFVFVARREPVRLRLLVDCGGQALPSREAAYLRSWFASRAATPYDRLEPDAVRRAVQQLPLNRLFPGSRPTLEELGVKADQPAMPAELADCWARRSAGRFLRLDVAATVAPHGELLTRALATALERNHQGRWNKADFQAAALKLLTEFDSDEDECLTPFEIVPGLMTDPAPRRTPRAMPAFVLLHPGESEESRVEQLLSAAPEGTTPATARGWLTRAADQTLTVPMGDVNHRQLLDVAGWKFDVAVRSPYSTATAAVKPPSRALTPVERDTYRRFYREAEAGVVTLAVAPGPRDWFQLLDLDADGQISVRELRSAWDRFAGKTGDVRAPDWDAPVLTLTFVPGAIAPRGVPLERRPRPGRGPKWFQGMDRNGDGDVSRREFLGSDEAFRKLDRDGDGLISLDEATAGDADRR